LLSPRRRSEWGISRVAAIQSAQTVAALRAAVADETSLAVACEDKLAKHFISLRERIMTAIFAVACVAEPMGRDCFVDARSFCCPLH
jgi:hypothetical protein